MGRYLVLLFIAIPLLEIAVFIQAGELIGLWPTLAGIVLTAVIGVSLLRWQGIQTLHRARADLERGAVPVTSMAEGVALIVAGAFLLTPGFVTDSFGFLLLVPAIRRRIGAWMIRHMTIIGAGSMGFAPPPGEHRTPAGEPVIDADYEALDDREPDPDSPWKGS